MEQTMEICGKVNQQLEIQEDCAIIKKDLLRKIELLTDEQCREILERMGLER